MDGSNKTIFLIQRIPNNRFSSDTELILDAIEYHKWLDPVEKKTDYEVCSDVKAGLQMVHVVHGGGITIVPIGNIEFVNAFLDLEIHHQPVAAINIPASLQNPDWLQRTIYPSVDPKSFELKGKSSSSYSIRPAEYIDQFPPEEIQQKHFKETIKNYYEYGHVYLSEALPLRICSSWRVFIYHNSIVDIKPYGALEKWLMPDRSIVENMVTAYEDAPPAYALDIAVLEDGSTALLEVTPFISCKLYGFNNIKLLPEMAKEALLHEISQFSV